MSDKNKLDVKSADFLRQDFLPAFNNEMINGVRLIEKTDKNGNPLLELRNEKGDKFTMDDINKLTASANTATQKLLDTAVTYLTCNAICNKDGEVTEVNPVVEFPLLEYADANGFDMRPKQMDTLEEQRIENRRTTERKKKYKKQLRKNLNYLRLLNCSFTEHAYRSFLDGYIIPETGVLHINGVDYIHIEFKEDIALELAKSKIMQFPPCLLKHDNHSANAYAIGRYVALHSSMDNNIRIGTANTLRVKTLLNIAPEIPSFKDIQQIGQSNWKSRIKDLLETALNDNIMIGFLQSWHYRDNMDNIYTPDNFPSLTYDEYVNLLVDYFPIENTFQNTRTHSKPKQLQEPLKEADSPS